MNTYKNGYLHVRYLQNFRQISGCKSSQFTHCLYLHAMCVLQYRYLQRLMCVLVAADVLDYLD